MRDIRQEHVPRWYELELVRQSFAVVLEPSAFEHVLRHIPRGACPILSAVTEPFVRPRIGSWGVAGCIRSFDRTDGRVTCEFFGETYRPSRDNIVSTTPGAESLDVLMTLLATYEGPGAAYKTQLITLDRIGHTTGGPDAGNIRASLSPAMAKWVANQGANKSIDAVRVAMLDSTRGTKQYVPAAINAWCSDSRQLLLENGGDISLAPTDRGEFNGRGYAVASKNVRRPPDHYALLCGLARLSELARSSGL